MKTYLKYPARFIPDEESGGFTVEFPDLIGCLTEGTTIKEAKEMAKDALSGYLDVLADEKKDYPKPSRLNGDDIHYITAKLGQSTYTAYHQESYEKNKAKVLTNKKDKELELKRQGYRNFSEFLSDETLTKLKVITQKKGITRREFLTSIIERESKELLV